MDLNKTLFLLCQSVGLGVEKGDKVFRSAIPAWQVLHSACVNLSFLAFMMCSG